MSTPFYLCLALLSVPGAASNCEAKPVSVPIEDLQVVSSISESFMVGVRATIGTPSQDIVMLPWAELNNTWIYENEDAGYCDNSIIFSDDICQVRRGQFFYESNSKSYEVADNMVAAGGASQEIAGVNGEETGITSLLSTSVSGTDILSVGSTNITGFPIGSTRFNWDHGYTTAHAMGLGKNSTYLNSLVQAGLIASRVWSIFWGRMWVDDWLNGSIVFGGYDSALVTGANYTQALDYSNATGCWTGMKVTISNIVLNERNGQEHSIFPANYALPVCIVPQRQLLIEAPSSLLTTFEDLTGPKHFNLSYGLHWSAAQYLASDYYDGDMTITLSSGLSVRVANDQFMVPAIDYALDGSRTQNDTIKEFLFNGIGSQSATLGRYFLTAAYLMVNHDANSFTMWDANPVATTDLVSVVSEGISAECSNISGVVQPSATSTATATSTAALGTAKAASSSTPVAAIAGGVAGGVAFLAAAAVLIFLILRRKRRSSLPPQQDVAELPPPPPQSHHGFVGHVDVPNQELATGARENEKLVTYEMPLSYKDQTHEIMGSEARVPRYEMDGGNWMRDQHGQHI